MCVCVYVVPSHKLNYPLNISETTLQLEALVGDLEDAVFCFVNCHSGKMFSAMLSNSSVSTGTFFFFSFFHVIYGCIYDWYIN